MTTPGEPINALSGSDLLSALSEYLSKSGNLAGMASTYSARTNLGLGNVENAAASALYVALTGPQNVAGVKTFSSAPVFSGGLSATTGVFSGLISSDVGFRTGAIYVTDLLTNQGLAETQIKTFYPGDAIYGGTRLFNGSSGTNEYLAVRGDGRLMLTGGVNHATQLDILINGTIQASLSSSRLQVNKPIRVANASSGTYSDITYDANIAELVTSNNYPGDSMYGGYRWVNSLGDTLARIRGNGQLDITGSLTATSATITAATPLIQLNASNTVSPYGLVFGSDGGVKYTDVSGVLTINSGRNSSWGGSMAFVTDTVERLRINSVGNTAFSGASHSFGGSASVTTLELKSTTSDVILKADGDDLILRQSGGSGGAYLDVASGGLIVRRLSDFATLLSVSNAGNVGLGTSPSYRLDVSVPSGTLARFTNSVDALSLIIYQDAGGGGILTPALSGWYTTDNATQYLASGNARMTIVNSTGNINTIGTITADGSGTHRFGPSGGGSSVEVIAGLIRAYTSGGSYTEHTGFGLRGSGIVYIDGGASNGVVVRADAANTTVAAFAASGASTFYGSLSVGPTVNIQQGGSGYSGYVEWLNPTTLVRQGYMGFSNGTGLTILTPGQLYVETANLYLAGTMFTTGVTG